MVNYYANVIFSLKITISFHVISDNLAPSRAPKEVTIGLILPTSIVLQWQPPPLDSQNGMIRSYEIVLVEQESGITSTYTTTETTLTISSLHPYYIYEYRVAVVTIAIGPFSEPASVQTLPAGKTRVSYILTLVQSFMTPF